MNARPWGPVLAIALVLIAASLAPRVTWREVPAASARAVRSAAPLVARGRLAVRAGLAATERHLAVAAGAARRASLALEARGGLAPFVALVVVLGTALPAGALVSSRARARRRRRAEVLRLARAGRPPAVIARRTALARDGVRMVLRPELATRRRAAGSAAPRSWLPTPRRPRHAVGATGALR